MGWGGGGGYKQVGPVLYIGADAVSWPAEQTVLIGPDPQPRLPRAGGTLLSLARAVVKESVHFLNTSQTQESHTLANGIWKLG